MDTKDFKTKLQESLKKIDFKDRKYALPAIAFPFVVFFAYQIYSLVGGNSDGQDNKIVTTDINDELPQIGEGDENLSRADIMKKSWQMGDSYSAMENVEKEEEDKLTSGDSYTEKEKQRLDSIEREKKQRDELIRRTRQQLTYNGYSSSNSSSSQSYTPSPAAQQPQNGAATAAADYARELRRIQQQLRGGYDDEEEQRGTRYRQLDPMEKMELERLRQKEKEEEETKIVKKVEDENQKFFHSVQDKAPDDELIKAMIDQTVKVQDGTRIRLKLLNDVTIDSVRLEKGTYLYALVKGFSGQRVLANISSILVGNTFMKVNLSLYDNDGMEGFYVPASAFREMVKNAGANAVTGGNMNMNNGMGSTMSGEYLALQAIQQAYSGVTQAVSSNIRKNKAKIKYNTVVYLINTK